MRPVIAAAIAVAAGGALFGSRAALAIGGLVTLLVLAGHPALRAVPKAPRLLHWAGLACLAATIVVRVSAWSTGGPWTAEDLRNMWQKPLVLGALQLAACLCFGIALARAPRERLRGQGPALPAGVGLLVLAAGGSDDAQTAWRMRPLPNAGVLTDVFIAVRPGPVLNVHWALTTGVLLIGAAMTVLGGAHLARR